MVCVYQALNAYVGLSNSLSPYPSFVRARLMPLTTDSWYLIVNTKKKDFDSHIFALPNTNVLS